jgi:hypothetical protein
VASDEKIDLIIVFPTGILKILVLSVISAILTP